MLSLTIVLGSPPCDRNRTFEHLPRRVAFLTTSKWNARDLLYIGQATIVTRFPLRVLVAIFAPFRIHGNKRGWNSRW